MQPQDADYTKVILVTLPEATHAVIVVPWTAEPPLASETFEDGKKIWRAIMIN